MDNLSHYDVFPAGSDTVPEGDALYPSGWISLPCKICGALVVQSGQSKHVEFHNMLIRISFS